MFHGLTDTGGDVEAHVVRHRGNFGPDSHDRRGGRVSLKEPLDKLRLDLGDDAFDGPLARVYKHLRLVARRHFEEQVPGSHPPGAGPAQSG